MYNMRIMILSVFLLILLIVASVHGVEKKNIFCIEFIRKAMKTMEEKTPPKFKEAHRKCMESKTKDFKDIEVQCEKEIINVPAQFVFAVQSPKEFISCALTALKEVNNKLTKEEKKKIKEMQADVLKISKQVEEIK